MHNENPTAPFQATKNDLTKLKDTAIEAAHDFGDRAAHHAEKAKNDFNSLAKDAQEEGKQEIDKAKVKLADIFSCTKNYVAERPLAVIGTALAFGFFLGSFRSRTVSE